MAVQEHLAARVKDTDRHRTGVPGKAAGIAMLCAGEAPEVSAVCASFSPTPAVPRRYAEEGAAISINTLQRTGGTAAVCGSVPESSVGGGAAPAAERGALGAWITAMTTDIRAEAASYYDLNPNAPNDVLF